MMPESVDARLMWTTGVVGVVGRRLLGGSGRRDLVAASRAHAEVTVIGW